MPPLSSIRNFIKLCKVKWYNFAPFYNIQKNYVAQCGDQTATGTKGQSIYGYLPTLFEAPLFLIRHL